MTRDINQMRSRLAILNKQLAEQKAARSIIVLDELVPEPKQGSAYKASGRICKAVTLSGKACSARATCGEYCKRHFFVSKE